MSEKVIEGPGARVPEFVEAKRFDARPGLPVQFQVARALLDLMPPEKITLEAFRQITRPFNMVIPDRGPDPNAQEMLVRDATKRLLAIMALVASEGDVSRANELLGDDEGVEAFGEPDLDFATTVRKMMER